MGEDRQPLVAADRVAPFPEHHVLDILNLQQSIFDQAAEAQRGAAAKKREEGCVCVCVCVCVCEYGARPWAQKRWGGTLTTLLLNKKQK